VIGEALSLGTVHIVYLMLLLGSLAFGFETLLLGFSGQLSVLYRHSPRYVLKLALLAGLIVVSLSIATAVILDLEPLYLCASVLAYILLMSRVVNRFKTRLIKPGPQPPPLQIDNAEIEQMLHKRGFDGLVKEEEDQPSKQAKKDFASNNREIEK